MNNVITFFVDSVTWNSIERNQAKVSPTPFLDSLKSESITTTKLYSHGPYTDAATHSLFTGRNCLDDFGYFFKLNTSPIHHYKVFHDAGYETYDFNYPYYVIGDDVQKYIDHSVYSSGYIFGSELGGIFNYYFDIVKERKLEDDEYLLLIERLRFLFESWMHYLDAAIYCPESFVLHNKIFETYDAATALEKLKREHIKYLEDPYKYVDEMLALGENHVFVDLDTSGIETYIDNDFIDSYIEGKYACLLNRISRRNFRANVFSNLPSFKRLLFGTRRAIKTKRIDELLFIQNYLGSLTPMRMMRNRWKLRGWQNQHSAFTMYQAGLNILKNRRSDNPFYFFFDVEEPHNNIAFFSYDIQDKALIDEEMEVLEEYVNAVGHDFKGSLVYLLSLRYSDYQIERFCMGLKEMGLWDKTTILVIADHGSSYTFNPIHNRRVNCFDDECYHIPMWLRHPGLKGYEITTYQYSKDVLPTLMDVLGLTIPPGFKGRSMIREVNARPFVIGEYMGPGCPDMLHRRIWFSARDSNYIVAYKVSLNEDFESGELAEVYNLKDDPQGYYNICDRIDRTDIQYLLNPIKERWIEIKADTNSFMTDLRNRYNTRKDD